MNGKGQAAMEYLILVGFIMALIIPLILLFYNQSSETAVQVRSQQLRSIGQKVVDNAESVYYLGEPSRLQFKVYLPDGINNVSIVNKALIFNIDTGKGRSDVVIPTRINMSGTFPITTGVHFVTVENRGSYVWINST